MTILNHLACPVCFDDFLLSIYKKTKERIIEGELKCKKCGKIFRVKNGIAYFIPSPGKQALDPKKARKIMTEQEIPKIWIKRFSKEELASLYREWGLMLSVVKKDGNTIHLDFATGTGRFLRNIVSKTKGEIIALDFGYSTCQELVHFLKRIKKYKRVSIVCADARKLPFKDDVFDSISSWHGLDEPKMKEVIKETKRVLKTGGYFTASGIHYQRGPKSFLRAKKHGIRFITKEAIILSMKDVNFRKVKHKIFFKGRWGEKGDYLPVFNDFYSTYGVIAEK
jgi:ubiquinone/menaquinone biosynthesis C-methylase UbiE/uncharacterized protein YbaR (Trm112 family)